MLDIKERDPLSNLLLEVLEDPSKKEMVYYLICYLQLVRREDSFHVELSRFLSCAYKNFQRARSYWKDLLVGMNLFVISDLYGNVYTGKDIYKVEEGGIYLISLRHEYLNKIEDISHKALKLWNILSRAMVYKRYMTAQDAVIISALMFNEGLYQEVKDYCELCIERYLSEANYFRILDRLSGLYVDKVNISAVLKELVHDLERLGHVFYGINLVKLRKDLENALKRVERGQDVGSIKIEFVKYMDNKKGSWFIRILRKLKGFAKRIFKKEGDNSFYSFGEALCSKSFRTQYTNL
ncbi:MAG: hypothetical protein ACK4FY_06920 [Aquificaceae bacterium]